MEKRFNQVYETDTLQVQFNNARQSPGEGTSEWADRLQTLADKAFRDVPEKYVQQQVITKFLQALNDKDSGKAAAMMKPKTIEEACQLVKLSQHLDTSIYGTKRRTRYDQYDEEPACHAVRTSDMGRRSEDKHKSSTDDQMAILMKSMATLQESTNAALSQMRQQMTKMELKEGSANTVEQRSHRDDAFKCYNCQGYGHIARYCLKRKPRSDGKRQPTLQGQQQEEEKPLNQEGSVKRT